MFSQNHRGRRQKNTVLCSGCLEKLNDAIKNVKINTKLSTKGLSMSILSENELRSIPIAGPPPVQTIVEGSAPPCYKLGYPTSDDKTEKDQNHAYGLGSTG